MHLSILFLKTFFTALRGLFVAVEEIIALSPISLFKEASGEFAKNEMEKRELLKWLVAAESCFI